MPPLMVQVVPLTEPVIVMVPSVISGAGSEAAQSQHCSRQSVFCHNQSFLKIRGRETHTYDAGEDQLLRRPWVESRKILFHSPKELSVAKPF